MKYEFPNFQFVLIISTPFWARRKATKLAYSLNNYSILKGHETPLAGGIYHSFT